MMGLWRVCDPIPCVIMIGDYPQIQGGQQIPSETNLWASLNLREVTCVFHKT